MKTKMLFTTALLLLLSWANSHAQEKDSSEIRPAIIELLENGESYSIEITSVGCFNGTRQTVVVTKNSSNYTADFQNTVKVLSEEDIHAFIEFESKLRSLKMGGCSTVDTYVLRYGGSEFRTSDGTCSWHGGSKLLKMFS